MKLAVIKTNIFLGPNFSTQRSFIKYLYNKHYKDYQIGANISYDFYLMN